MRIGQSIGLTLCKGLFALGLITASYPLHAGIEVLGQDQGCVARLPLLRLRGGKIKYKDLRAVKELRARGKVDEYDQKPKKHKSGKQFRKKQTGKRPEKTFTDDAPETEREDLGLDKAGMEEWKKKGDNIWYGGEAEPEDEQQRDEQFKMEAEEAVRLERIQREDFDVTPAEHRDFLIDTGEAAFPPDSSDEEAQDRGGLEPEKAQPEAEPDFFRVVFGADQNMTQTAEGLERLVREVEGVTRTLRDHLEPLVLKCWPQAGSVPAEGLSVAERLLFLKYQTLLHYAASLQRCLELKLDGRWSVSALETRELQHAWARVQLMLPLEDRARDDIQLLLSAVEGEGGGARRVAARAASAAASEGGERERRKRAALEEVERKGREADEEKRKVLEREVDPELAERKGPKHWRLLHQAALKLRNGSQKLSPPEKRKAGQVEYYAEMYRLAHQAAFPREVGEARKPAGGATIIMDGQRRPAPLEILTNTRGVWKKYRSRKYSNPRLRLRHRFHDLVIRSRGASRGVQRESEGGGGAVPSGINPKARHSKNLRWKVNV